MRKPVWRRDWAGFSGGWYGQTVDQVSLTVLGVYQFGYYLDVTAPLVGDLRVGYRMKYGRNTIYARTDRDKRAFVFERRSLAELREAEAEAVARNREIEARVQARRERRQ